MVGQLHGSATRRQTTREQPTSRYLGDSSLQEIVESGIQETEKPAIAPVGGGDQTRLASALGKPASAAVRHPKLNRPKLGPCAAPGAACEPDGMMTSAWEPRSLLVAIPGVTCGHICHNVRHSIDSAP